MGPQAIRLGRLSKLGQLDYSTTDKEIQSLSMLFGRLTVAGNVRLASCCACAHDDRSQANGANRRPAKAVNMVFEIFLMEVLRSLRNCLVFWLGDESDLAQAR